MTEASRFLSSSKALNSEVGSSGVARGLRSITAVAAITCPTRGPSVTASRASSARRRSAVAAATGGLPADTPDTPCHAATDRPATEAASAAWAIRRRLWACW